MTYIPKQTKLTKERVEARLESGLVRTLERYCQYLDSDRDYVVAQALEIAFRKDKEFIEWQASQEAKETAKASPQGSAKRASNAAAEKTA